MNHATRYGIGSDQTSTRCRTKETAQADERICHFHAEKKRRRRNKKRQTQVGSCFNASTNFLRTPFLPRLEENITLIEYGNPAKLERDFYKSLSIIADHYKINLSESRQYGFPYNISLAMHDLSEQLETAINDKDEARLIVHEGQIFFAKEDRFEMDEMLYYIPVIPLYLLLKDKQKKQSALLLLSVYTYLYCVADTPYYRQEGTYLYWIYENVIEMEDQAFQEEREDKDAQRHYEQIMYDFKQCRFIGDIMQRKISNVQNLNRFESRLKRSQIKDSFDIDCHSLAQKFFDLYKKYPSTPFYQKFTSNRYKDREVFEVGMDNYISFFASDRGVLSDCIIDHVNCDLQEWSAMDVPIVYTPFDKRKIEGNNFDFEKRFFHLIEELAIFMNKLI